jgi:hypothetical protein
MNMLSGISTERLMEIEEMRSETASSLEFQMWAKELGVSSSYVNREGIHRANDMMGSYQFGKKDLVVSNLFRIFTK